MEEMRIASFHSEGFSYPIVAIGLDMFYFCSHANKDCEHASKTFWRKAY